MLIPVVYGSIILDTCRLQVAKVTKGALNLSQSGEARRSITEHLFGLTILT